MNTSDRRNFTAVLLAAIALSALVAFAQGCASTVTPKAVAPAAAASYDGNERNSGIIALSPTGWVVTDHFRERYNALVDVYGARFSPQLRRDDGVTRQSDGRWVIDRQRFDQFLKMNTWRRSGISPGAK